VALIERLRRDPFSAGLAIPVSPAEIPEYLANASMALLLIVFVLPLMVLVAVAIAIVDPGPIVFKHRRVGRSGNHFYCYKFRTMVVDAEARLADLLARDPEAREEWTRDHKLRVDPRTTPLGRFLRRTSLDELPQLFNILRGEMNLVGPRPIVDAEVVRYGRRFAHYCRVKPGLTGLWQVSGRNDVSYRRRVATDSLYAQVKSPVLDAAILLATVPAVLLRKGSY
jgi:exopolysaccharide production protein ExoY